MRGLKRTEKQLTTYADILSDVIQASGLTISELARRSGVHRNCISRAKNGRDTLTLRNLYRLLKEIDCRGAFADLAMVGEHLPEDAREMFK